jgi:hypothetical protein
MENINELIGQEAFEQITRLDKQLGGLINQFEKSANASKLLNNALSGTSGANSRKKAIDETATSLENLSNVEKEIIKTEQKLADANDVLATKLAQLKLAVNEQNKSNSDYAKTNKQAEGSINALSFKLTAMRKEYDALSASLRNSPIGKDLLQNIQKTDSALKQLDATTGRHQRNVGNYQNQLFGLTQVFRELPGFTYSAQTGILGLSNNLPILADNFKSVANATNQVTGKINGTAGALKIFASSIFSFGNIFAIAIGLFTIFSKEIFEFFDKTKKAVEITDELTLSIAKESTKMVTLKGTIEDVNAPMALRLQAISDLKKEYPTYFEGLSNEALLAGQAADQYDRLSAAIEKKARANIAQKEIEKIVARIIQAEKELASTMTSVGGTTNSGMPLAPTTAGGVSVENMQRQAREAKENELKILKEQLAEYIKINIENSEITKETEKRAGNKIGSKSNSKSATKDKTVKDFVFEFQDLDRQITLMNEATDAEMLERVKKGAEERLKRNQDYAKMELELIKENLKAQEDMLEREDRLNKEAWDKKVERLENYAKLVQGFTEILTTISNAQYESEMSQIEQRSKFIEDNYDSQLKKIERSNLSQQKKEEATQKLETQTEALTQKE